MYTNTLDKNQNIENLVSDEIMQAFNLKKKDLKSEIKKVLFIQPLQIEEEKLDVNVALNKRYYMYPPYGIGILNTITKRDGFKTKLLDLNFNVFKYIHERKNVVSQDLTEKWKSMLRKTLVDFQPDLVGVSCTFTMNHKNMMDIFKVVKEHDPKTINVAGGVHVSNATKIVLEEGKNIDFANTYEAETSFIGLLNTLNGVSNKHPTQLDFIFENKYYSFKNRELPKGRDLDIVPDFDTIELGQLTDIGEIGTFRYWRPKDSKGSAVLSNKGCRARCSFCSVRNFNGKGVRAKSVDTVITEIKNLKEKHGINHITWLDDDLLFDTQRTLDLFNAMIEEKLNVTWDASNGLIASAVTAHPELMEAAEKSGCIGAYFGIESGNDKILKSIYKPSGVKHYKKLGPIMNRHPKIFTRGFLIIGFPDENLSQIMDTINVSVDMGLDWFTVQLLTPLPSTEIYDQMVEAGKAKKDKLNLDGEGFTMFSVRESERQRKIEEENKRTSTDFVNLLNSNKEYVPNQKELNDLWFLTDYEINYKPIFKQENVDKLIKLECFLTDVSNRMTRDNPLSNYFLSIVKKKLNKNKEEKERIELVSKYLKNSNYWKERFKILDLNHHI